MSSTQFKIDVTYQDMFSKVQLPSTLELHFELFLALFELHKKNKCLIIKTLIFRVPKFDENHTLSPTGTFGAVKCGIFTARQG